MDAKKSDVLITLIISLGILLLILSFIIRNYMVTDLELIAEAEKNMLAMSNISIMVKEGYNPIEAGCSSITKSNEDICKQYLHHKKEMDLLKLIPIQQ